MVYHFIIRFPKKKTFGGHKLNDVQSQTLWAYAAWGIPGGSLRRAMWSTSRRRVRPWPQHSPRVPVVRLGGIRRLRAVWCVGNLLGQATRSWSILFYSILSYPIYLSYLILSNLILSHPTLPYPILSYPTLSYLSVCLSVYLYLCVTGVYSTHNWTIIYVISDFYTFVSLLSRELLYSFGQWPNDLRWFSYWTLSLSMVNV